MCTPNAILILRTITSNSYAEDLISNQRDPIETRLNIRFSPTHSSAYNSLGTQPNPRQANNRPFWIMYANSRFKSYPLIYLYIKTRHISIQSVISLKLPTSPTLSAAFAQNKRLTQNARLLATCNMDASSLIFAYVLSCKINRVIRRQKPTHVMIPQDFHVDTYR